jgi:hypothetical protein
MMAITAAVLLGCGSAFAQIGGMSILPGLSPLGMTSPLGIGPGSPVAPTNLPLGATELASLGVSPDDVRRIANRQHNDVFRRWRFDARNIFQHGYVDI